MINVIHNNNFHNLKEKSIVIGTLCEREWQLNPWPAELYFLLFEAGIANAIFSSKWRKNIYNYEKIDVCYVKLFDYRSIYHQLFYQIY